MRIKVCGMTKATQVKELDETGVEFAGFIFYPKSPRYVFKQMPAEEIKKIKGHINKVGVFVNETPEELLRIVDNCGLYLVQLHGDETPRYCEKISNYISVIKAFRINDDDNIEWKIKNYVDVVDMFMFDTGTEAYGGSGKKFDWEKLKNLNINKPFFLSGGIGVEDAEALKNFSTYPVAKNLFAVDVNSKFEILPGIKDIEMIKNFVTALNV
jgi:phosphoribosylanthranilate isomerase